MPQEELINLLTPPILAAAQSDNLVIIKKDTPTSISLCSQSNNLFFIKTIRFWIASALNSKTFRTGGTSQQTGRSLRLVCCSEKSVN